MARLKFWKRDQQRAGVLRHSESSDAQHLRTWVSTRTGIEGYVEPRTAVTDTTLLLVAIDGEWTRRRVPDARWAHGFCNDHRIPSYDASVVGYPERMRAYNRRRKDTGV